MSRAGTRWRLVPARGLDVRRRSLRAGDSAPPRRAAGHGRVRLRRALPRCASSRRSSTIPRRPTAGDAPCAPDRASPPARSAPRRGGRTSPALDADRARGQEDGSGRGRSHAEDPRGCAPRAGPGARAVRRRRLVARDRARSAVPASSRMTSWPRWPISCVPAGVRLADLRALGPARRRARAAGEQRAEDLGVAFVSLIERVADRPSAARDGQRGTAGRQRARRVPRALGTPPPGTGALLDDRRMSGWTLAMVGGQLRRAGAPRVVPVALATLQ